MTTTTTNGSVRKTLASQLDRLDSILDGLRTLRQNLDGIAITVAKPTGCNPWA
jgi:hypothetical protein